VFVWRGLAVVVGAPPRPPPTWPTITIDVGMVLAAGTVPPVGVGGWNERLFVRLIVSDVAVPFIGTVINTGDQEPGVVMVGATALGFSVEHVAVDPPAGTEPQK
jgi:hypothetical protein